MSAGSPFSACVEADLVELFAIDALPLEQKAGFAAHLGGCAVCQRELRSLEPVVKSLASWPGSEISPEKSLWQRLESSIGQADLVATPFAALPELDAAEWEQPAPGIFCRVLSTDRELNRVSLLVRLDPGVAYPPHTHAGLEELHLLDGELWIEDRKLSPGDYNRAEPGSSDHRVWSETGCTCVLITSPGDVLR
jgi:quercetin dioxygenase-like cupin family protein